MNQKKEELSHYMLQLVRFEREELPLFNQVAVFEKGIGFYTELLTKVVNEFDNEMNRTRQQIEFFGKIKEKLIK
jgi:hypothetical protein